MPDPSSNSLFIKIVDAFKENPKKGAGIAIFSIAILVAFMALFVAKPSSSGKFERVFLSSVFGFVGLVLLAKPGKSRLGTWEILICLVILCILSAILFPVYADA